MWKALDHLHQWERDNLPESETAAGGEILIWLLKCKGRPRPLKDLYRSSRFSEPTIRASLRTFVERGFVEIDVNDKDMRNRFAYVTPKFQKTIEAYWQRFNEVVLLLEATEQATREDNPQSGESASCIAGD